MHDTEKITLKNINYTGSVGVSDLEHRIPTRLEVDLEIYANLKKACKSDDLNDTIDYVKIHDLIKEVIARKHHNLLESLAEDIAQSLFDLRDCDKIVVRLRKPHPPLVGACDYAEVEIVRHKHSRR